jgi:tetratricopeptide (TPR) repeat protein
MTRCPPPAKWQEYIADRLSADEARILTEHAQACEACEDVLAGLAPSLPPLPPRPFPRQKIPAGLVAKLTQLWSGPPPADPSSPQAYPTVAGYEILGVLGRGGMGVVYQARQRSPKRTVALKMLPAAENAGPNQLARFRREAEAAARLQHPHIVPIYEVGEQHGRPFFSMALVEGGSLAPHIPRLLSEPRQAARLVAAVAQALHYAHSIGFCHRDIKPANILLRRKSAIPNSKSAICNPQSELVSDFGFRISDFDPQVTDFGLAKPVEGGTTLTGDGTVVGTPGYVAPEQIRSEKPAPAADIYGLGALLYECLTGQPPFRAATPFDTLLLTLHKEPQRPRLLNSRLHRDLETVCLKCLEKEPGRRYPTAAAVAEDLERWLRGEPVQARRIGPVRRAWRWCRRKPLIAGLAAALGLAVAFGSTASVVLWREAAGSEARALAGEADALANLGKEQAALRETEEHYAMLRRLVADNVRHSDVLPGPVLRDAEKTLSDLLKRRPNDREMRLLLADVLTSLGDQAERAESAPWLDRAERLLEPVPAGLTQDAQQLVARIDAYLRLGRISARQGQLAQALRIAEKAFVLWQHLVNKHPAWFRGERLFKAVYRHGEVMIDAGHPISQVMRRFEFVRRRPGLLGGQAATNLLFDLLRVHAWCKSAERHYLAGRRTATLTAARQAAAILDRYYRPGPLSRAEQLRLALHATDVAVRLRWGEAPKEALAFIQRVNLSLQEAVGQAPGDFELLTRLAHSWFEIDKAYWDLDRQAESVAAARQAIEAQRQAFVLAPAKIWIRRDLGPLYTHLGRRLCELGQADEAEDFCRQCLALWPGDADRRAALLQNVQKWAAEATAGPERQRYLDLYARLKDKRVGPALETGKAKSKSAP